MKGIRIFLLILIIIGIGLIIAQKLWVPAVVNFILEKESAPQPAAAADYKDATYIIDGAPVTLKDGTASSPAAPGSASMITTRYFGNELKADLNGDGKEDVAFILAQEGGGSGTFFYAVAAVSSPSGYVGTNGYLLGDRIAPQATTLSQNPAQKGVVVFNFADRAPGEPMTAQPGVGKSAYLKVDPSTMRWAVVEPDFEGESR